MSAVHNAFPSLAGLAPGPLCEIVAEAFLWKHMKARPKYVIATDVDPETYDDYVGKYDYPGALMTVTRDGDKLMAQITGQPAMQIYPAGDDTFFWKIVDADVKFIRDENNKVSSVRHTQGIAKFVVPRLKRIKDVKLSKEVLDRFVGKYSYKGLGELTIRREGDQLFAQMTGQPENRVYAKSETELFWRAVNAQLKFDFDEEGNFVEATHFQGGGSIGVNKIE